MANSACLGFDEKFTGFGARDVKFLEGERFVGFPEDSCPHGGRQSATAAKRVKASGGGGISEFGFKCGRVVA